MFPTAYRRLFVGAVLGLFAAGCAEERTPINRVQPEALAKSFFVGKDLRGTADDPEFYKRGTVIDVGYGAVQDGLFTSTYAQPVSRIRWEVTEERLNARLSYERISGTDDKGDALDGITPKPSNDGQIVASYAISSHFDISRQYNPQTGEELNVIVENSEDRPWFEREHFRVDWSKNLVTEAYDYDTLSMMGLYGGIKYEPISYTILDPKHPDAPHFDDKSGYFDVTNKVYAAPQMVDEAMRISSELNACRRRVGWTAPECDEAAKAAASAVATERGNPSDPSTLAIADVAVLPPVQLAGVSGNSAVSGDALSLASPLALNNPLLRARLRERKENALAARGACIVSEAPEPSSLAGLADILKNKFPASVNESAAQREERYKRMFHYVQRRYTVRRVGA